MPINLSLHAPAAAAPSTSVGNGISMISGPQATALPTQAASAATYPHPNGTTGFHAGGSNGLHAPLQPQQLGNALLNRSPLPVTPLSPNNSHVSLALAAGMHNGHSAYIPTYGIRPSTATPPMPKLLMGNGIGGSSAMGRDACGSVSPGVMIAAATNANGTLELSNNNASGAGISPHELSTLV